MSHENRRRISIEIPGKPQMYQPTPLEGWDVIGVVERAGEYGALVRNRTTGIYAKANAGALIGLSPQKVEGALKAILK